MLQNTREFWKANWEKHFSEYVRYVPFQAYYLYFLLEEGDQRLLEIAGGSFHDTACLNKWGVSCEGIDFCPEVVEMARWREPRLRDKLFVMNARRMTFADKAFDVSFHNGFFVNFSSDEDIRQLLKEQVRVTKRLIVCSVHNRMNQRLKKKFSMLSAGDDLYNIRFYTPLELRRLLMPFCRRVKILPFQIPEFDRLIALTHARDFVRKIYSQYYHASDIGRCKRLMAVGYL